MRLTLRTIQRQLKNSFFIDVCTTENSKLKIVCTLTLANLFSSIRFLKDFEF